eukprot:UN08306
MFVNNRLFVLNDHIQTHTHIHIHIHTLIHRMIIKKKSHNNHAQIANLRQHLNETQLLTQKYMNNNGNFTPNGNHVNDNNIYDNDRKEGDYETFVDPYLQERRASVNSQDQDAGSIHSDEHS